MDPRLVGCFDFDAEVPQELKDAITALQEQIISGELTAETPNAPN